MTQIITVQGIKFRRINTEPDPLLPLRNTLTWHCDALGITLRQGSDHGYGTWWVSLASNAGDISGDIEKTPVQALANLLREVKRLHETISPLVKYYDKLPPELKLQGKLT